VIKKIYICDECKGEIPEPINDSHGYRVDGDRFSVTLSVKPSSPYAWPDGFHICKYCVVDLIAQELDDRSKE